MDPRGIEPLTSLCHSDVLPLYHGPEWIYFTRSVGEMELTEIPYYGKMVFMNQVVSISEIIKVQPRGVITIPRKFRGENFAEDSFVRVVKADGKLILEPVTIPRYPVRRYTNNEVAEFLEADKHESTV